MKKIYLMALMLVWFSANVHSYEKQVYKYSVGVSSQLLQVSNDLNVLGVDDPGYAFGLYYKAKPSRHWQLAVGADYVMFDDTAPQYQVVEDKVSGDITSISSDISGYSVYGEVGVQHQLTDWTVGAMLGYRQNSIGRVFIACSGCVDTDIPEIKSGFYIKPFVEYQFTREVYMQLGYSIFESEKGIENSIGLQVSFYSN